VSSVTSAYPVECAFLDFDKTRTLEKAVKQLEDKGVASALVVHLSPSSYSNHHEEVKYRVGLRKELGVYTVDMKAPIKSSIKNFVVSPGFDDHPLVADILTDYARELSRDPQNEFLVITGHGPVEEIEDIMWINQYEALGKELLKKLPFRDVAYMTLRYDSADLIRHKAKMQLRQTVEGFARQGRVIVLSYALGPMYVQGIVEKYLKGIPNVAISQKGIVAHPNTKKWLEKTIALGLQQPQVVPIERLWSHRDWEAGKARGAYVYGFYK
ncbi:MAG: hypothetical protein GY868_02110, partial [Deltaproteobacteria bacterium]|nr:hypothetical protein [Deltaproteobacteria bacterium]